MEKDLFYETPFCVERLGEQLFLKLPLYQSQQVYTPIYINEQLYKKYFFTLNCNWQHMSENLSHYFSVTLNSDRSNGKQVGWAYVDRQADPLGFALAGNEGSGRAFYTGREFNIKGEKTPLAVSKNVKYSSGVLNLHDAIWSTIISNVFYDEIKTGLSPVLAILDLENIYTAVIDNNTVSYKTAYVIRIDDSGSLDRVSHCFYHPAPITRKEIAQYAKDYGKMEGEKIIHRLLHGAWSTANISTRGQLIDFDTSRAVKGRQPQFTASQYESDNYFGFESGGQMKVIHSILNNGVMNFEDYSIKEADLELMTNCYQQVSLKLAYLMGFENYEEIYRSHQDDFSALGTTFLNLSHFFRYKAESCFNANSPLHLINHLFDFSAFFRIYPIRKINHTFSIEKGLYDMMYTPFPVDDINLNGNHLDNYSIVMKETCDLLHNYWARDDARYAQLKKEAMVFVERFDQLYTQIVQSRSLDQNIVAARAYVINEDRIYLFLLFNIAYVIINNPFSPTEINKLINNLINMSQRVPQKNKQNRYYSDQRIFENGSYMTSLDTEGFFQIVFQIKKKEELALYNEIENFYIEFNHTKYPATVTKQTNGFTVTSEKIKLTELARNYSRDDVFLIEKYRLYYQTERFSLRNYFINIPDVKNYLALLL